MKSKGFWTRLRGVSSRADALARPFSLANRAGIGLAAGGGDALDWFLT